MIKKAPIIISIVTIMLSGIAVGAAEYKNETFSLNYDENNFIVYNVGGDGISIIAANMPDAGTGHNTVLGCLSEEHKAYHQLGELNENDKREFQKTLAALICTGLFEVDEGISVVSDGHRYGENTCEYSMMLSDGTECYTTVYNYEEVIHYSVCRLCPYTAEWNDEYRDIYRSIRLSSSDQDDRGEEQTEKTEEECNFRNAVWGMSREDVKKLEGKPVFENEMEVWYEGIDAGKDVDILYQFDQDKLIKGTYFFTDKHENGNLYYKDYIDLVKAYSGEFGEPVKQAEEWRQDRYRYDRTKLGTAIAAGHVSFITQWENDTSLITVKLYGDDDEIKLIAFYEDKNYKR